uniref:C2H2-type domain-containing protein n=1 Tax=Trypanosoma congolense (strain IL3000) TaxID=1068625 RepID=G0UQ77_TRYCI|nr:conserved hypothetical protein [Trypanosoma congolense IL3000]
MSALDFHFIEGSERLDWGVLVNIDIQRLMKDTNVDTLQRVVENIAFARLTRDEAAMFSPEHFIHLYTICQLVIQYLVYSQERLARINVKLSERVEELQQSAESMKQEGERLHQENTLLRKEVKAQRRTLLAYEYNRKGSSGGSVFVCPQCGEVYGKSESLQSHMRKRHLKGAPVIQVEQQPRQQAPSESLLQQQSEKWKSDYDVKMNEMQEKLRSIEQLLERERDRNDRLQRESMMMMMQAAMLPRYTPTPPPLHRDELRSPESQVHQKVCTSTGTQPSKTVEEPGRVQSLPTMHPVEASEPSAPPPKGTTDPLFAVPIVPDVALLQQYNNTRQQEAASEALLKQIIHLEKTVEELREKKEEAAMAPVTTSTLVRNTTASPSIPSWLNANEATVTNSTKPAMSMGPSVASAQVMPEGSSPGPQEVKATPVEQSLPTVQQGPLVQRIIESQGNGAVVSLPVQTSSPEPQGEQQQQLQPQQEPAPAQKRPMPLLPAPQLQSQLHSAPVAIVPEGSCFTSSAFTTSACSSSNCTTGSIPKLYLTQKPADAKRETMKGTVTGGAAPTGPLSAGVTRSGNVQSVHPAPMEPKLSVVAPSNVPDWLRSDTSTEKSRNASVTSNHVAGAASNHVTTIDKGYAPVVTPATVLVPTTTQSLSTAIASTELPSPAFASSVTPLPVQDGQLSLQVSAPTVGAPIPVPAVVQPPMMPLTGSAPQVQVGSNVTGPLCAVSTAPVIAAPKSGAVDRSSSLESSV